MSSSFLKVACSKAVPAILQDVVEVPRSGCRNINESNLPSGTECQDAMRQGRVLTGDAGGHARPGFADSPIVDRRPEIVENNYQISSATLFIKCGLGGGG
jgi:hypothetical protein